MNCKGRYCLTPTRTSLIPVVTKASQGESRMEKTESDLER
jgi:hypothetical protein